MLDVEIRTKITYDSDKDESILKCTRNTLEDLYYQFSKAGNGCTEEMNLLKGAAHIIDEVLREETF